MVRAKAVKDMNVAKVLKVSISGRSTAQLACSPPIRSDAAKKSGNSILDKVEHSCRFNERIQLFSQKCSHIPGVRNGLFG